MLLRFGVVVVLVTFVFIGVTIYLWSNNTHIGGNDTVNEDHHHYQHKSLLFHLIFVDCIMEFWSYVPLNKRFVMVVVFNKCGNFPCFCFYLHSHSILSLFVHTHLSSPVVSSFLSILFSNRCRRRKRQIVIFGWVISMSSDQLNRSYVLITIAWQICHSKSDHETTNRFNEAWKIALSIRYMCSLRWTLARRSLCGMVFRLKALKLQLHNHCDRLEYLKYEKKTRLAAESIRAKNKTNSCFFRHRPLCWIRYEHKVIMTAQTSDYSIQLIILHGYLIIDWMEPKHRFWCFFSSSSLLIRKQMWTI